MALNFGMKSIFEYLRGHLIELFCQDQNSSIEKIQMFFQNDEDNYDANFCRKHSKTITAVKTLSTLKRICQRDEHCEMKFREKMF